MNEVLSEAEKKPELTAQDINKRLAEVQTEVKSTFEMIQTTKDKLNKAIKAYKYLLNGAKKSEVETAVNDQITVLREYEKKQNQLIDSMQQKKAAYELISTSSKLPGLSDEIAKVLGQDQLLKLMVDIDLQIQLLQKRKQKLKQSFEQKRQYIK